MVIRERLITRRGLFQTRLNELYALLPNPNPPPQPLGKP